jgi:hypothetical protein
MRVNLFNKAVPSLLLSFMAITACIAWNQTRVSAHWPLFGGELVISFN